MRLSTTDIDYLIDDLRAFHAGSGAVGGLLDERRLGLLLEGFRRFLDRLSGGADAARAAVRQLADAYLDADIPFALLMGGFNVLKERLATLAAAAASDPLAAYAEADAVFERAKRDMARAYLRREAAHGGEGEDAGAATAMRPRLLVRLCQEWMGRIREAIGGSLERFPLEPADRTEFARALRYPESMLICLDLKVCDQIEARHRLLVQQAGILHAMLAAERYEQAYIAYRELAGQVAQLCSLLGTLYLEAETNRLHRFFRFVQAALYLPGRKHLAVINLRQLNKINRLYGNEAGNRALDLLERALERASAEHQAWMVYTRGIAGDFYVFTLGQDAEPLDRLLREVAERLGATSGEDGALPFVPTVAYHGIELTTLTELTAESMHLIVQYLTERGRREPGQVSTGRHEAEAMMDWLRTRHRHAVDLRAKLTAESTEIFIQPLVTLDDRRDIHAFEVLGRFREGEGFLPAGMFVDDVVSMGLTLELDLLVLGAIVRHAPVLRGLTRRLFVNVFPTTLGSERYLEAFHDAMAGPLAGLDLVVELTERMLLERQGIVRELHGRHGLSFAIDDFGVGYSSLGTVIDLALEGGVRYLKIDGSLTRSLGQRPASERVMRITRQMARELGMETVVEMVETPDQAERLRHLEIDFGQGYFLGVPDPVPVWQGKLAYLRSRGTADGAGGFPL